MTNNWDFEQKRTICTRKTLAFFRNLLREYQIFAFAKLNKYNFTTCHQIVTLRAKDVQTLAVPVIPSWCWKSPSVFLAYTNTIVLSHTSINQILFKKSFTRSNRSINHRFKYFAIQSNCKCVRQAIWIKQKILRNNQKVSDIYCELPYQHSRNLEQNFCRKKIQITEQI